MIWKRQEWWVIWVAPSRPAGLWEAGPGPGEGYVGEMGQGTWETWVLNALLWTLALTQWEKRRHHGHQGGIAWGQEGGPQASLRGQLEWGQAESRAYSKGGVTWPISFLGKDTQQICVIWPVAGPCGAAWGEIRNSLCWPPPRIHGEDGTREGLRFREKE